MYFYIYCDIFTLFDSVSFTLQCSDQNYYNPNWNHVTHSPPWTLKCLSCRALLKKTKKNWIQYSPAPSWKYTPRKNDSLFLVQGPRRRSHQMWALCLSATTGAFHFRISLRAERDPLGSNRDVAHGWSFSTRESQLCRRRALFARRSEIR